jgi:hypothetical protein
MNLNTGKPWSDMDLANLANDLTLGTPLEAIAEFLCRDLDEVRDKLTALAARTTHDPQPPLSATIAHRQDSRRLCCP